jgi:hypothetical protein
MKLRPLFAACALVALSLLASPKADACINGVELEMYRFNATPAGQILLAEKDLEHGNPRWAASRVRDQFPNIRSLDATAPPLALRAQRVYALAIVRTGGAIDAELGWARWGNHEWALATLRDLARAKADAPAATTDLAEAQVELARTRDKGVEALEALDGKDLLGSPFAYLALARARRATGDDGGVRAALLRCSMMSNDRKRCELKG